MEKIFIYTVSDFKPLSIECIEMLFSSFLGKTDDNNIQLAIISNKDPYKYINPAIKIIKDSSDFSEKFIGFLKFSEKIPSGYDRYIYLDSDILFFGKYNDLYDSNKQFSIVRENWVKMTHPWHYYKYSSENSIDKIKNLDGINSGTFSYIETTFSKKVRDLFTPHISNDVMENIKLEQSSFNFAICKEVDFTLDKCKDLTSIATLFAQDKIFNKSKLIYHFNGFSNEMKSKHYSMQNFLQKINLNFN